MRTALLLILIGAIGALSGCGHKKHTKASAPPPPPPQQQPASRPSRPPAVPAPVGQSETGVASWYGHPYHGRQAADGEIYDMETLVAAHRTLPFNTWVRVVNLRNNKSVDVRIIDRGPFVDGRIIDLSHAAADAIDLVRAGIGPVKLEVISGPSSSSSATVAAAPRPVAPPPTRAAAPPPPPQPAPVEKPSSNAFAVQIGIYYDHAQAERIRADMATRYGTARVVPREGLREMWRVLVGAEATESGASAISERLRQESGERNTFIVRLDSY